MPLSGTVIRFTTGGGRGRRRKKCLIVVPGNIDFSKQEGETARQRHWRLRRAARKAAKNQRVYRIRHYPEGINVGDTVPYKDLEERKGRHWEAEYEGFIVVVPKKVSPLEQEIINYPNLHEERRSNVISGLGMLVDNIKSRWKHSKSRWTGEIYERPVGTMDPLDEYIKDYVEVDAPTLRDREAAITHYKAILHSLHGKHVEARKQGHVGGSHSMWGAASTGWVERTPDELRDFLKEEIGKFFRDWVRAKDLKRFEKWVDYQRARFGYR